MGCTLAGLHYPEKRMSTVYRSSCSDPLSPEAHDRWSQVEQWLTGLGESLGVLAPGVGPWGDPDWWLVADPTGGSLAKESLPVLMGGLPQNPEEGVPRRAWWSMSDNSLVLNALVDRGHCRLLHGHPLALAGRDAPAQRDRYGLWAPAIKAGLPFPPAALPRVQLLRGRVPAVWAVIGGNITALERLGESPWRPRPRGRILLLESLLCPAAQAPHRIAALVEDPWWEGIGALALGRFTAADKDDPGWVERSLSLLPPDLPVVRIPQVGHGADGWTIPLGEDVAWPVS